MHIRFGREVCSVAARFGSGCEINTETLVSRFCVLYSSSGITLTQSFRSCKNDRQLTFFFYLKPDWYQILKPFMYFFPTEIRNVKLISTLEQFCLPRQRMWEVWHTNMLVINFAALFFFKWLAANSHPLSKNRSVCIFCWKFKTPFVSVSINVIFQTLYCMQCPSSKT